jgi:hypothetical protein
VWFQYVSPFRESSLCGKQSEPVDFFQAQWCQAVVQNKNKKNSCSFCKPGVSEYMSIRNSTFSSNFKEETISELASLVTQY